MTYRFSAPGRTEICGNHTDHQHGLVFTKVLEQSGVNARDGKGKEAFLSFMNTIWGKIRLQ